MAEGSSDQRKASSIECELYFLIERFLSTGPCKDAAKVLRRQLHEHRLLPKRLDWTGAEHERSFESLLDINGHISGNHLLKICERLGPLLDEKIRPSVMGVKSLLGAGSQSLLRTEEDIRRLVWLPSTHVALRHGKSVLPPVNLVQPNWLLVNRGREMSSQAHRKHIMPSSMYQNIKLHSRKLGHLSAVYCVLFDRTGGYIFTGADDLLVKIWQVSDGRLKATLRGHSAEITDITVNYENTLLASGSCDKTVRVWCLRTKATVAVLQGHTGMITSLQFSPMVKDNLRYLASTGGDGCVCFWKWFAPENEFVLKPVKHIERSRAGAQMLCSSFSPGGMFFAAGSSDHVIRMYHFQAGFPEKIGELEKHTDRVDSVSYANHDNRFVSGSRDGVARIWKFERNEWHNIALDMKSKPKKEKEEQQTTGYHENEEVVQPKVKVTMVSWTIDDSLVITAITDYTIRVWCSYTGQLKHVLKAHEDEVFVLEPSPVDNSIMVSAGHDGNIFIWDIHTGTKLKGFFNLIEGQGHGAVFDCKFSPDGTSFAATDSHGHLMIHGFGSNERHKQIPEAVFFHTDYRPLIRDTNNYVLDEQTQQAPHLMPPPFLVDIDGNPYPPILQRLVPGREHCKDDQLVPQLAVNEAGEQQVMGDSVPVPAPAPAPGPAPAADPGPAPEAAPVPAPAADPGPAPVEAPVPATAAASEEDAGADSDSTIDGEVTFSNRPSIDQMIQELQRQQDERMGVAASGAVPMGSPPPPQMGSPGPAQLGSPPPVVPQLGSPGLVSRSNSVVAGGGQHMVGMRRVGETEGVRQSGIIQQVSTSKDIAALSRRIVVRQMDPAVLRESEKRRQCLAEMELRHYATERRRKALVVKHGSSEDSSEVGVKTRKKKKKPRQTDYSEYSYEDTATNRLVTRALYDTEEEAEQASDGWNDEDEEMDDGRDSSDYSDWGVDTGSNLEPPKRTSKRVRKRKRYTSSETEEESLERSEGSHRDSSPEGSQTRGKAPKKKDKPPPAKKKKVKKKAAIPKDVANLSNMSPTELQELIQIWKPPDWLTDTLPRKQPYFPQMGDELIFFRQGHELYVKAVERRKTYPIDSGKNQPWHKNPSLREQELVRIIGVRYELLKNGVRLCCLKLNYINPVTLRNSGGSFNIKYHDMPDVVDFLVLKQNYDIAMDRNWKPGDRFRSMIDDSWWMGIIEAQIPYQEEFPDSMFLCFKIRWDNSDLDYLSPWDLEPLDERRPPLVIGGGLPVTPQEVQALMYKPRSREWPGSDQHSECDRIVHGWEQVMTHSLAEPFLTPVDLNKFPFYAMTIEYPMDLNTIKRRLENRFYRRVTALQFDLRYIETNAVTFNEPESQIVKSAQILTDALLKFISDPSCTDPCRLISKRSEGGRPTESEDTEEEVGKPGSSKQSGHHQTRGRSKVANLNPDGWKKACRQLLETIVQCEDSAPFREPVDIIEYPHYYEVIEEPLDLGQIRENLNTNAYKGPTELARDMRTMFSNSKCYNTNKRSKIYTMTLRLSAMFEVKMKEIVAIWRKAMKNQKQNTNYLVSGSHMNGVRNHIVRPFSSVNEAGTSGLTNGRSQIGQPVPASNLAGTSQSFRPKRERRVLQRGYSYAEHADFPDPKPDYTDDDFELPQRRLSPKKKSFSKKPVNSSKFGSKSKSGSRSKSSSNDGSRYSTRAATGTIKTRTYTNEGSFSEEEFYEEVMEPRFSDSDVDVESHVRPVKRQVLKGQERNRRKAHVIHGKSLVKSSSSSKQPLRKGKTTHLPHLDSSSGSDSNEGCDSKSGSSSSSSSSSGSGSSTSSSPSSSGTDINPQYEVMRLSDSDTEPLAQCHIERPNRPVHHLSQGSHRASGKQRPFDSIGNSSYAKNKLIRKTRNQGKQTILYNEDDDSDNDNSDGDHRTVSMRGRVRKPTARARALWD